MGMSITTAAGVTQTGSFQLSDTTRLFDEQLRPIDGQPGATGLVGVGGPAAGRLLQGSRRRARARSSRRAHGRFSVPGDWAVVNDDGKTLTLLGRGSVCINTGGEKVFPEEVEEVVKRFAGVHDCRRRRRAGREVRARRSPPSSRVTAASTARR